MKKYIYSTLFFSTLLSSSMVNAQAVANPTISSELYSKTCPSKSKCTDLGLYMSVEQAKKAKEELKEKALFLDVRTLEEVNYVGTPTDVDGYLPLSVVTGSQEVDDKKNALKLKANDDFVKNMDKKMKEKELDKDAPIFLICRSGERSARATDILAKSGYTQVYSIVEGFEGDMSSQGKRNVNGWKNSGLPWEYKVDPSKVVK